MPRCCRPRRGCRRQLGVDRRGCLGCFGYPGCRCDCRCRSYRCLGHGRVGYGGRVGPGGRRPDRYDHCDHFGRSGRSVGFDRYGLSGRYPGRNGRGCRRNRPRCRRRRWWLRCHWCWHHQCRFGNVAAVRCDRPGFRVLPGGPGCVGPGVGRSGIRSGSPPRCHHHGCLPLWWWCLLCRRRPGHHLGVRSGRRGAGGVYGLPRPQARCPLLPLGRRRQVWCLSDVGCGFAGALRRWRRPPVRDCRRKRW